METDQILPMAFRGPTSNVRVSIPISIGNSSNERPLCVVINIDIYI